ncbi:MAG: histidine phosphatase family protein [Candidatus Heimdallarchaeota archaeon]|nr:histidine phosphatase family protein [Candidatus Heimdallarchaeota archaeon]
MLQGQFNSPLSSLGRSQAKQLRAKLDFPYDGIFSSTLDRAYNTAEISTFENFNNPIIKMDGLQEMNFGRLQQTSFNDFTEENWKVWDKMVNEPNFKDHGGESRVEFFTRVSNTIEEIIQQATLEKFSKIAVFTHGGVLRVLFQYLLKIEIPTVSNVQIMRFRSENGKLEFEREFI